MHPSIHALHTPDRPAYVMTASGRVVTYAELDRRSNQIAHLFRSRGLRRGDVVVLMMENNVLYHQIAWAAQRSGLYLVFTSSRLTPDEMAYILDDSKAKMFVTSRALAATALPLAERTASLILFMSDGAILPFEDLETSFEAMPASPIGDETCGSDILYSSGTTGRPKGIAGTLLGESIHTPDSMTRLATAVFGMDRDTIYLSPAPLYHAAPLRWTMAVQRLGGTVLIMEKFDAEEALALIERYAVTHAQFVPTHFVRMLRLPVEVRERYARPALKSAVHSAAPCPVPIKEAMIDWWGPVLVEYYGASEGNGITLIQSADWLAHKGSVGRPVLGELHICDDAGEEVPARVVGNVYFSGGTPVAYRNDPDKTAKAFNRHGWSTVGDVGWIDDDGYLYLTDRASFMIISGGVNVYPQEIENLLQTHPAVFDVAVFGAPDADLGERVVAVVQPTHASADEEALRQELYSFLRDSLSGVKMPKQIDFRAELPRHPTGKLYKRLLRDEYVAATAALL